MGTMQNILYDTQLPREYTQRNVSYLYTSYS